MFRRSAPPTCQGLAEYQLSDISGTLGKNGQPSGSVVGVQSQMELCDILVLFFFSRQNLETFDISHAFLPLTVAKLSTLKNSPVFIDPPRIVAAILAELRLVTDRQTDRQTQSHSISLYRRLVRVTATATECRENRTHVVRLIIVTAQSVAVKQTVTAGAEVLSATLSPPRQQAEHADSRG